MELGHCREPVGLNHAMQTHLLEIPSSSADASTGVTEPTATASITQAETGIDYVLDTATGCDSRNVVSVVT